MNALASSGLTPVKPQGSYFVLADISAVRQDVYYDKTDSTPRDHQFCRWLTKVRSLFLIFQEIGVAAIPPSAFYCPRDQPLISNFARFAFCKTDESIRAGKEKFKALEKFM